MVIVPALLKFSTALSLLAPAGSVPAATQLPIEAPAVPSALVRENVCTVVQITGTHFSATSHSASRQWLLFEGLDGAFLQVEALGSLEQVVFNIPDRAVADKLTVRVAVRGKGGALGLSAPLRCAARGDSLVCFVDRSDAPSAAVAVETWISSHGGRSLSKTASVLPSTDMAPSTHVPVPMPAENKNKRKRRRIERKKLPPV